MKLFHILIVSMFLIVNSISVAFCQDVTLSWDPSPTEGVSGYKVYYKQGDMNYPFDGTGADQGASPVDVGDVLSTTLTNLPDDTTFFFSVTAYVDTDQESSYSNIVSNSWIPALLLPENGANGEPVPVTFQWETAPAGYNVRYTLIYGTDRAELSAAKAAPFTTPSSDLPKNPPAVVPLLFVFFGFLLWVTYTKRGKYRSQIVATAALIVLGGLVTSCGGGGGGDSSSSGHSTTTDQTVPTSTLYSIDKGSSDYHQAYDLKAATTYYWKVVATDSQNPNLTYESEVSQFTTENF